MEENEPIQLTQKTTTIKENVTTKGKKASESQEVATTKVVDKNMVAQITQAIIAVSITLANIYIGIKNIDSPALTNVFLIVIGYLFGIGIGDITKKVEN